MVTEDGKKSIIILSALTVLTTIFVILRFVLRKRNKMFGVDDWLLAFALFMLYVQDVGAFLLAIKGGEGKPMATLTADETEWLFKMFFWPELGYTILITTIKFSILISYKRIFDRIQWFRIACYVVMTLVGMWGVGVFFAVIFQCTPVDKAWKPLKPGHCIDLLAFLWGNSISNNILDYMILLLPVIPVWQLQVSKPQRLLLLGSFALGSVACVAGTLRATATGTIDITDLSKSVFWASIWTYIEPSVGIMGACLPFLAQIFRKRLSGILNAISSVRSKTTSLLGLRSKPASSTGGTATSASENKSKEVRVEQYEMLEEDGFPATWKTSEGTNKADSVRALV